MIQELNEDETLSEAVEDEKTLVDFYADWCGPCRQMEPVVEQFAEDNEVSVVKVDVDENPGAAQEFGIRSVPTFIAFDGGEVSDETVGSSSHQELADLFG